MTRGAAVLVPLLVAAALWFGIGALLNAAGVSGDPWSFEETLPKVTEDFGGDTRVLSILAAGGSVAYELIGTDGTTVHTRRYHVETKETRGPEGQPAQSRTRKTDNSERAAKPKEVRAATVTLAQLDPDVVKRMWEEADFPSRGSSATLTERRWVLTTGARPFDRYVANFDGTGLRQTQTKDDVFDQDTSVGGQELQEQLDSAEKLTDCLAEADQDPAAMQACVGQ